MCLRRFSPCFRRPRLATLGLLAALSAPSFCGTAWGAVGRGELRLQVVDAESQRPLAFRMHLKSVRGKPIRPPRVPYWHDHFAADGAITLELKRGQYLFDLECGPEYKDYTGHFEIKDHADDGKSVEMHRFVDLKAEGWWSGDLMVDRPLEDLPLLMRADDLHLAPVIGWRRERTKWTPPRGSPSGVAGEQLRFFSGRAGLDAREGGGLLYFGLSEPLDLSNATAEYPPSGKYLIEAKQHEGVQVIAANAFCWDLPMWLASGRLDGVIVAGDHLLRDGVIDNEARGKPRDRVLFPPPHGVGRWSEAIYYHVLNSGLRIPCAAGSGTGIVDNPLGYNRTYVYCGDDFTWDAWWENFATGRVFITNGPLLRVTVQGEPPGCVFRGREGETLRFEIALKLSTREKIDYLEIVQNGRAVHQVRLDEFREAKGRLPIVEFDASGWFLVRAVTNNTETYRYAATAPYYVEFDDQPLISRASVEFFRDWALERGKQINLADPAQQADALRYHRAAFEFWQNRLKEANAE